MKSLRVMTIMVLIISMIVSGCSTDAVSTTASDTAEGSSATLDENLPDNDMDPDYEMVFNDLEVMEYNISIDSEDWEAMQADLAANLSSGGNKAVGNRNNKPNNNQENGNAIRDNNNVNNNTNENNNIIRDNNNNNLKADNNFLGGNDTTSDYDPIWVEASVTVDGITWDHVGIRYKGNSSLTSAYQSGNNKLSFKLDFDEFEDVYPETEDQRFYGFKQLNLNNNYSDSSLMREKIAADLFDEFGVEAADTTFCVVYVDHGEGSQYYGVYTLVEEIDDTGITNDFDDDSGNLYKPDGNAASFAAGTFNEAQMVIKSNEEEADYTDVQELYEIINSDTRVSDVEAWKSDLEAIFDVDNFLKYLAVNNTIQNWDTYGNMTHNYYIYNNPETHLLTWIPWDNNEAFTSGKGNRGALSLSMDETNESWPLINYITNITEYEESYNNYLDEFVTEVFTEAKMIETYELYYDLIKEYAYAEEDGYTFINSDTAFDQAVEILKTHVVNRNEVVDVYLN